MIGLKLHGILVVLPQKNPPVVIPPPGWTNGWWNVPRFPEPPETQCRPNVDHVGISCRSWGLAWKILEKMGIYQQTTMKFGEFGDRMST